MPTNQILLTLPIPSSLCLTLLIAKQNTISRQKFTFLTIFERNAIPYDKRPGETMKISKNSPISLLISAMNSPTGTVSHNSHQITTAINFKHDPRKFITKSWKYINRKKEPNLQWIKQLTPFHYNFQPPFSFIPNYTHRHQIIDVTPTSTKPTPLISYNPSINNASQK